MKGVFERGDRFSYILVLVTLFTLSAISVSAATTCSTDPGDVTISSACNFDSGTFNYNNLIITSSTTVTITGNVILNATNITIDSGSSLNGDNTGDSGGVGDGGDGSGTGGGLAGNTGRGGGGAGHGGKGGDADASQGNDGPGSGGIIFGNATNPTDVGSGGGGSNLSAGVGGNGGGAITLNASDTLTINGDVTANGEAGDNVNSGPAAAGGGSGGSVRLLTTTLAGSGSLKANGGAGGANQGSGTDGGGGGGGRIAMTYTTSAFNGTAQTLGGAGGAGDTVDGDQGQDGTIAVNGVAGGSCNTGTPDRSCTISGTRIPPNRTFVYRNLTFASGTTYQVNGSIVIQADNINLSSGSTIDIRVDSSLSLASENATLNLDGLTELVSGSLFRFDGNRLLMSGSIAGVRAVDTAVILNATNTTITSAANITVRRINITTGNMTMAGIVSTTARGEKGGQQNNGNGLGGGGAGLTGLGGGGAGHGGKGGKGNGGPGTEGITYGSSTNPVELGSGGGGSNQSGVAIGGDGGGAILINVTDSITLTGSITANGEDGDNTAAAPAATGGGSGGSIRVFASTWSGDGSITVNGGDGGANSGSGTDGGGGGGGRIAVTYTTTTYTGITQSNGGVGGADGGGNNGVQAEDGTIAINTFVGSMCDTGTPEKTCAVSGIHFPPDEALSFQNLTLDSTAHVIINVTYNVSIQANTLVAVAGANISIQSSASLTMSTAGSTINLNGKIELEDDAIYTFNGDLLNITGSIISPFSNDTSIAINATTLLLHTGGSLIATRINVTAGNVTVNGTISASDKGFQKETGPGAGTAGSGGGGAGYGGSGGDGSGASNGGSSYGNSTNPLDLGSGGGGGNVAGGASRSGGAGGGAILFAIDDTLLITGIISADGTGGIGGENGSGGGSGGSIRIGADNLTGNGSIQANGGIGGNGTSAGGGGGSCGRIALTYSSFGLTGNVLAENGAGGSGGGSGASGTCVSLNRSGRPRCVTFRISAGTTDWDAQANLSKVPDPQVVKDGSLTRWVGSKNATDLACDDNIRLGAKFMSLNTVVVDEGLNATARVSLDDVDCGSFDLFYSEGFLSTAAEIVAAGTQVATQTNLGGDCTDATKCVNMTCADSMLNFTALHFDGFATGGNANLTINDSAEGSTAAALESIDFFAFYINKTSGEVISPALGGNCNVSFDDGTGPFEMTFNGTSNDGYNFTKTNGFSSSGLHLWNVTCAGTNFQLLTATDNVTITASAVPEFSTWAIILILMITISGFFLMRKEE